MKCPAGSGNYSRGFPWRKPSLDQEDTKPLHIKRKQEELLTSEGWLQEVDVIRFPFNAITADR